MRHSLIHLLPYRPDQLFAMVGDVEAYPRFVPWITAMRVWNRREESAGVSLLDAEAAVGFSFLRERFSTRVRRDANRNEITVSLLQGPFKTLVNRWKFSEHPAGTQLEFVIDFEFKSHLLQTVLAANFHRAVEKLVACFEDRAKVLYGQDAPSPGARVN
ncbi:MAG: SRPBCC family protein [Caulobacteraceae bacterium]|nr:SRPBCC family protein [Caulobacteraceae bacterium]